MAQSQQPPSQGLVGRMLASHSALGIFIGGVMYLICLSGTVAVFYEELERWEQPNAPVVEDISPEAMSRAAFSFMEQSEPTKHLYIGLPTADAPRFTVSGDTEGWFADRAGNLVQKVSHEWTHFLIRLHIYLHLPSTLGFTLVGIAGVLLTALIISGFLAHPRIFRDAFAFRWNRSPRLAQADLHNRLSVWASPFHLAIALTGAFIGLSIAFLFVVGLLFYDGDREKAGDALASGDLPADERPAPLADFGAALATLRAAHPGVEPFSVIVHEPGTRGQFIDITAELPRRLVYGERWRFDAEGSLIEKEGWSDGAIGKQIYISTYKVHFGSFGGLPVKLAYFAFGLGLSVVSISGFNIWLIRRRDRGRALPHLELLWTGLTWGAPTGMAVAWMADESMLLPPTAVFWGLMILTLAGSWFAPGRQWLSQSLRSLLAVLCLIVAAVHALTYGLAVPVSFWMDLGLLLTAIILVWSVWLSRAASPAKLAVAMKG
jgi:hypothetical protein